MTKISRKQKFIEQIEHNILSGKWKIGDRLPTERELVEIYGASRTVVNAALSELAQKGFLNINPRQWTQVADYKKEGTLSVLISIMAYNGDDVDFGLLQSVLDARRLVETESARLAAQNHTQNDIERLEEICENENSAETLEARARLDYSFHHALSLASGNIVYPLIINSFEPFAKNYLEMFYAKLEDPEIISKRHKEIVSCIKKSDADNAVKLVNELLLHGERILKTQGGK